MKKVLVTYRDIPGGNLLDTLARRFEVATNAMPGYMTRAQLLKAVKDAHIPLRIEVYVRDRGEEGLDDSDVDLAILRAVAPRAVRVLRHALRRVDRKVDQRRDIRLLSAHPLDRAALPARGLLTLITEHAHDTLLGLLAHKLLS